MGPDPAGRRRTADYVRSQRRRSRDGGIESDRNTLGKRTGIVLSAGLGNVANEIRCRENPGNAAIGIYYGQASDFVFKHQACRLRNGGINRNRDNIAHHDQVQRTVQAFPIGPVFGYRAESPADIVANVAVGHQPDQAFLLIQHGKMPDALCNTQIPRIAQWGIHVGANNITAHKIHDSNHSVLIVKSGSNLFPSVVKFIFEKSCGAWHHAPNFSAAREEYSLWPEKNLRILSRNTEKNPI